MLDRISDLSETPVFDMFGALCSDCINYYIEKEFFLSVILVLVYTNADVG